MQLMQETRAQDRRIEGNLFKEEKRQEPQAEHSIEFVNRNVTMSKEYFDGHVSVAKLSGAVVACWAHNPEVARSRLVSAIYLFFFSCFFLLFYFVATLCYFFFVIFVFLSYVCVCLPSSLRFVFCVVSGLLN